MVKETSETVPAESRRRSPAEWTTFSVAAAIVLALVAAVVFDWQVNQTRPPVFKLTVGEVLQVDERQYHLPFRITNTGGRIARTVQVMADLRLMGPQGPVEEHGEQQIDFLSGQEQKQGSFVFTYPPSNGELVVRVASYGLP